MRAGLIRDQLGSASRPAWSDPGDRDAVEQRQQLRIVTGLASREQHPQRQPAAVDGEVNLRTAARSITGQD
ncbi:hypothetical protein, partial [Amycolatopsis thermoflava]|uniref:hypothetical protein n=1 Tax=Amycolatopsis thermoflava TaxID=84480 RepID=UPI003EB72F0A